MEKQHIYCTYRGVNELSRAEYLQPRAQLVKRFFGLARFKQKIRLGCNSSLSPAREKLDCDSWKVQECVAQA